MDQGKTMRVKLYKYEQNHVATTEKKADWKREKKEISQKGLYKYMRKRNATNVTWRGGI